MSLAIPKSWVLVVAALIAASLPLSAQTGVSIVKSTNGQDANTAPGPVLTVGSTVTWTYVVTAGSRDLTNITVTDDQGVSVSCPATTLAAGTSMTCTASGTAVAGQYANVGTVDAMEGGNPVSASDPSHYFGQPAGLITLVKSTNGQDANSPPGPVVAVGSTVNWTYVVTNTDTQTITGVSVTDDQGVAVSCPAATLAPGTSMTCTATGIAQAGQYSNIGTATATHPTFGTIVASDPSHYFGQSQDFDYGDAPDSYGTTFGSGGPSHALGTSVFLGVCVDAELDAFPSAAADGDDANVGTPATGACAAPGDDEDGVTFNTPLQAGQNVSMTVVANAGCTLSAWVDFDANGSFADAADNLYPGGTPLAAGPNALTFSVPGSAAPGPSYARFRCTTDGAVSPGGAARDGEVEDYAVAIVPVADLSVAKTAAPDPVTPGTNLTFSITAANAGPSVATNVSLSDLLPAGTTFVSLAAPAGWSCATPPAGGSGTITCTLASMPVGNAAFTLVVNVASSFAPGSVISNTATITSPATDFAPGNNSATATTTVGPAQADLSVTKNGTPDPVTPGTNLTYSIALANAGPSDASSVTLSDTLPAGTTFVSLTAAPGWTCSTPPAGSAGAVSCSIATFPPGNAAFTLVVAVGSGVAPGGTISNTATIASSSTDPAPGNNTATATATVAPAQADLSVTKTATPSQVNPGDDITYTITVDNAGPSDASSVALSDPIPPETTFKSLTAPAGWTCSTPAVGSSGTVDCSIATMTPGSAVFTLVVTVDVNTTATSFTNTATVSAATSDPNPGNNSGSATPGNLASIPALSPLALIAMLLALAGVGVFLLRGQP